MPLIFGFRNFYNPFGYSSNRGLFDNYPMRFNYFGDYRAKFSYKSDNTPANKPAKKEKIKTENTDLRKDFVSIAQNYSDCKESDKSHLKFCVNDKCKKDDPKSKEWCADFVTYVVKEGFTKQGQAVPQGFGSHDVKTMKEWALNNGYFLKIAGQNDKADIIKQKVKAGDIVIFNEPKADGTLASHTGFVKEVDTEKGTFKTIEGNKDDRVGTGEYSPNYSQLSGFIQLT